MSASLALLGCAALGLGAPRAHAGPSLPLLGHAKDLNGKPAQVADRLALVALLEARKFDALTQLLEGYQAAFEQDPSKEAWPSTALDAFETGVESHRALLDAWVKHDPKSFAPYAARGAYFTDLGRRRRGNLDIDRTSDTQLKLMGDAQVEARTNLQQALELRPKLVAAYERLIRIGTLSGMPRAQQRALLDKAVAICPSCVRARVRYMRRLEPRWGGSRAELEAFAKEAVKAAPADKNLAILLGQADWDDCDENWRAGHTPEALELCNRALSHGAYPAYLATRAQVLASRGTLDKALADLDAAVALSPQDPPTLLLRAKVLLHLGRYEDAAAPLMLAAHLDPTDEDIAVQRKQLAAKLMEQASDLRTQRDPAGAKRALARATELDPTNPVVLKVNPDAARNAPAVFGAVDQPRTLEEALARDAALSKTGEFDKVILMWTNYIDRNRSDSRAYLERAGAYKHLDRPQAAFDDLTQACDLGSHDACEKVEKQQSR